MIKIYLNRFLKGSFYILFAVLLWIVLKEIDLDRYSSAEFENFRNVLKILFYIYMISIAIGVFLSPKNPSSIISWLMVFVAFPFWGFLMYLFFGRSFNKSISAKRKAKFRTQQFRTNIRAQKGSVKNEVEVNKIMKEYKRLIMLLLNNSESLVYNYNESEIFSDGYQLFDSLIQDILSAKHSINLEYFIIKSDETGNILKDALIKKARDGVEVRILYDGVGSFRLDKEYINELKSHENVKIEPFSPVILPSISRELNYRNHRKIAVIDSKIAYIGGMNIGDEYRGLNTKFKYWKDTHLRIKGEAVVGCQRCFMMDWAFATDEILEEEKFTAPSDVKNYQPMQIAIGGPDTKWESMLQAFISLISGAKENIRIITPYLVPDKSIVDALRTAALSGVNVEIIIPDKPDHFFAYWATRSNIKPLIDSGVKVYEYKRGFIHSKTIVVDESVSTIGSTNLDYRSLEINFEINAFIYDADTAIKLKEIFINDLKESEQIEPRVFAKRPFYQKILEGFGKIVSPLQ